MLEKASKPHVTFTTEGLAVKNSDGTTTYVNKNFAHIQQAGSKDTVDKIAEEWLQELSRKAGNRADFDPQAKEYGEWFDYFSECFKAYLANQEMPLDGFPLKMCAAFTPAERMQCEAAKVFTLEVLAAANEETLARMGMGSRVLKNKAIKILEVQQGGKVAEQNAALQLQVEELKTQVGELKQALMREGKAVPIQNDSSELATMKEQIAQLLAAKNVEPKKRGRPPAKK